MLPNICVMICGVGNCSALHIAYNYAWLCAIILKESIISIPAVDGMGIVDFTLSAWRQAYKETEIKIRR